MKNNTRGLVKSAIIAALYTVLTLISAAFGLSSGVVQVRISEALCVLPCFTSSAAAGLAAGCFISNLIAGGEPLDMIAGTFATLAAALLTRALRKNRLLAALAPVVVNAAVIPLVLVKAYGAQGSYLFIAASVFAGEAISCGLLGGLLYKKISSNEKLRELISD